MAAPVYDSRGTIAQSGSSNVTSISVTAPTTVNSGDLLLLLIGTDGDVSGEIAEQTSSDWTAEWVNANYQGASTTALYSLIADGSEDSESWTFTWSTSQEAVGVIYRITGNDTSSWKDGLQTNAPSATENTLDYPAITTGVDECLVFHGVVHDDGRNRWPGVGEPTDANFTEIDWQESSSSNQSCGFATGYQTKSTAGAVSSDFWTLNSSDSEQYGAFSLSIKPPSGGIVASPGSGAIALAGGSVKQTMLMRHKIPAHGT